MPPCVHGIPLFRRGLGRLPGNDASDLRRSGARWFAVPASARKSAGAPAVRAPGTPERKRALPGGARARFALAQRMAGRRAPVRENARGRVLNQERGPKNAWPREAPPRVVRPLQRGPEVPPDQAAARRHSPLRTSPGQPGPSRTARQRQTATGRMDSPKASGTPGLPRRSRIRRCRIRYYRVQYMLSPTAWISCATPAGSTSPMLPMRNVSAEVTLPG